jgi:hypothetical protein
MNMNDGNITSIAAARKAREAAARKSAASANAGDAEAGIKTQVWVLLSAIACAYLAYAYFAGVGH